MRTSILTIGLAPFLLCCASSGASGSSSEILQQSGADAASVAYDGSANLPACAVPTTVTTLANDEDADSGAIACSVSRTALVCKLPGGGSEACTSDNAFQCPDGNSDDCVSPCASNEYAVSCGTVGPAPTPAVPKGCRPMTSGPGGGIGACCPC